ncbi:MAG: hypothetical protein LBG87_07615, partial [Spirochaetaceae bacterium]|nr:hypothetical protein [Spirochaetaceae bacterium]
MKMILSFYTEKKPRAGEDSEPIAEELGDKRYLLGVFDGLGGAGAKQWSVSPNIFPADDPLSDFNGKTVTGAKLAANIIREEVLRFFKEKERKEKKKGKDEKKLSEELTESMTLVLKNLLKKLEGNNPASRLKSGMLKSFPTTMAVCYIAENRGDFIWAGDSRGYILDADGLHQYTKDDLKSEGDALDNLNEDSPMSNYICET